VDLRKSHSRSTVHRAFDDERDTAQKAIGRVYRWIALVIAGGVIVQFFLAGMGLFGAGSYDAHIQLGWTLHGVAMAGFVAAVVRPRTTQAIIGSGALLVALTVQVSLPGLRNDAPWLAAFHPVLALAILYLAVKIGMPALQSAKTRPNIAEALIEHPTPM
jgi:peptidoglycan/LPS O-acetylase OafA/YrhL